MYECLAVEKRLDYAVNVQSRLKHMSQQGSVQAKYILSLYPKKIKNKSKHHPVNSFFFFFTLASKLFGLYLVKYITGATRKCSQTQNCV